MVVIDAIGLITCRTPVNCHRIPVIYCSEHEAIVVALHCQQYVHGLHINKILVYVNTSIFCVNKRIFVFCISFCYSDVYGSPAITSYTTFMSSSVFEIDCVSQMKTRFKQPFVVLGVTFPH